MARQWAALILPIAEGAAMDTFLWVLQFSGVGIALVGLGRERWIRLRWLRGHRQ